MLTRTVVALVLVGAFGCSEECVREACDATGRPQPAGELEQGIVGVIAYQTDACMGGSEPCCECMFRQARSRIFGIAEGVRDAADPRRLRRPRTVITKRRQRPRTSAEPAVGGVHGQCDVRQPRRSHGQN